MVSKVPVANCITQQMMFVHFACLLYSLLLNVFKREAFACFYYTHFRAKQKQAVRILKNQHTINIMSEFGKLFGKNLPILPWEWLINYNEEVLTSQKTRKRFSSS
jgi:hypothetical protein